jgi:hypothetical protein
MDYIHIIIILLLLFILYRLSFREGFAAFSTPPITDPALLDPNTFYTVGTLVKSNTVNASQNGGKDCIEFPKTIYVPAKVTDATCLTDTEPALQDTYYTFGTGVQGFTIFPRFFTKSVNVSVTPIGSTTQSTPSTLVTSVSYNDAGTVAIIATTSPLTPVGNAGVEGSGIPLGALYYSNNITSSSPSFTQAGLPDRSWRISGVSLSHGTYYLGFNSSKGVVEGWINANMRIWTGIGLSVDVAVGWVPNVQGASDWNLGNVGVGVGSNPKEVYINQYGTNGFRRALITSISNATFTSVSMDRSVISTVEYVPGTSTTAPISNIFIVSLHAGPEVNIPEALAKTPGGIGREVSTFANNNSDTQLANPWYKVVGAPNNIKYVSVGVDLRAFAVDDTGALWVCNNVSLGSVSGTSIRPGTSSSWIKLGTPQGVQFTRVFYRKNLIDTAFAIDTTGKLYYQTGVDAIFSSLFKTA